MFEEVDRADQHVVEVEPAGAGLRPLVVGERHGRTGRPEAAARDLPRRRPPRSPRVDPPALRPLDLVREVLGRREPVVAGQAAGEPREDRQLRVEDLAASGAPSWWSGQKWRSWLSAWAWNVRAVTPGRPSDRRRSIISPAALSVNVTTSTWSAGTTPEAIANAVRRLITRVLPVPAPAMIATGPSTALDRLALRLVEVVEEVRSAATRVGTRQG